MPAAFSLYPYILIQITWHVDSVEIPCQYCLNTSLLVCTVSLVPKLISSSCMWEERRNEPENEANSTTHEKGPAWSVMLIFYCCSLVHTTNIIRIIIGMIGMTMNNCTLAVSCESLWDGHWHTLCLVYNTLHLLQVTEVPLQQHTALWCITKATHVDQGHLSSLLAHKRSVDRNSLKRNLHCL